MHDSYHFPLELGVTGEHVARMAEVSACVQQKAGFGGLQVSPMLGSFAPCSCFEQPGRAFRVTFLFSPCVFLELWSAAVGYQLLQPCPGESPGTGPRGQGGGGDGVEEKKPV